MQLYIYSKTTYIAFLSSLDKQTILNWCNDTIVYFFKCAEQHIIYIFFLFLFLIFQIFICVCVLKLQDDYYIVFRHIIHSSFVNICTHMFLRDPILYMTRVNCLLRTLGTLLDKRVTFKSVLFFFFVLC